MIRSLFRRFRRTQGMTEYIVIVGLVGILLVAAVTRYKDQIEVTIMGSAGSLQKNGADEINNPTGGPTPPPAPSHEADGTPAGNKKSDGSQVFHDGSGGYRDGSGNPVDASDIQ